MYQDQDTNEHAGQFVSPRRWRHFDIFTGQMDQHYAVKCKNAVGIAFQREGSHAFRIKLWMFGDVGYILQPLRDAPYRFSIFNLEEREDRATKVMKTYWRTVGDGEWLGDVISLQFHLIHENLFLILKPAEKDPALAA